VRAGRCYRSYGFVESGRPRTMERDPAITEIEPGCPLAAEADTRPISRRAPGVVSNRRSSVTALMVSVCLQPR
jgi:hypothetical protein